MSKAVILEIIKALGGRARLQQIRSYFIEHYPHLAITNQPNSTTDSNLHYCTVALNRLRKWGDITNDGHGNWEVVN